jgi:hypothetical protein
MRVALDELALASIHRSAWKGNSAKFGVNERGLDSSSGLVTIRTWERQNPK